MPAAVTFAARIFLRLTAATPQLGRGYSVGGESRRGRSWDVVILWEVSRGDAAAGGRGYSVGGESRPQLGRGYSVETSRGEAAAGTRLFRGR